jgi:TIR domain
VPGTEKKVFISYRRSDAAAMSSRIYQAMATQFGRKRVFRDTEDIPVGVRFPGYLQKTLLQCRVAFVLIGPTWLHARNPDGTRRLDDPSDFVRVEVETALSHGLLVCPLLLDGASMPTVQELPPSIQDVHWHNALPIRSTDAGFAQDMKRLVADIKEAVEGRGGNLVERFAILGRTTAIPLAAGVALGAVATKSNTGGNLLAQGCSSLAGKVGAVVVGVVLVASAALAVLRPSPPFPPSGTAVAAATNTLVPVATTTTPEYVLDTNRQLWLETPPFGTSSPQRSEIDGNVLAFQALSTTSAYVLVGQPANSLP